MAEMAKAVRKAQKLGLTAGSVTFGLCCDTGEADCASKAEMKAAWKHLKAAAKARRRNGQPVAAVKLQCVDVCRSGPVGFCTGPDGTRWYGHCDPAGIDRILSHHLDAQPGPDDLRLDES